MFREYSYIHATPHNRASFVRLFWKCYRQIGKKGGICCFRFSPLFCFFVFETSHNCGQYLYIQTSHDIPDKDCRDIYLATYLQKQDYFFSLYLALFSISCNKNQTFDATIGLTTDSWLKLFVLNKGPKLS